jgi:hypothetical protein
MPGRRIAAWWRQCRGGGARFYQSSHGAAPITRHLAGDTSPEADTRAPERQDG